PGVPRPGRDDRVTVTVLGVRHHGPGSARAVRAALHALDADMILVEGPAEAGPLVRHVAALVPPVAVLAHATGRPGRAAFWPFAEFSPEWQAVRFAAETGRPVRFVDLPAGAVLAGQNEQAAGTDADAGAGAASPYSDDPLGWLSRAAGHDDPERWWEDVVEHRLGGDPLELFAAVAEAMTELRQAAQADGWRPSPREQRREAAMRRGIRAAVREGRDRVAVVCGAWHVPALAQMPPARADTELLRGLPTVKASATWVPWTSQRLTYASGYGAGIGSPGWYAHLWRAGDHIAERWVARVAALLREADLAASPASAVETVRLAEALAALRGRSLPGLSELTDATLAVLCQGDEVPLALIHGRLVVGDELGAVPADVPTVPLHADFEATVRRLRFRPTPVDREVELDLRGATDRDRSRLLHRLRLLGIYWGEVTGAQSTGTFREGWLLRWRPEYVVSLIERARYGTTVGAAAAAVVTERAGQATEFSLITGLVEAAVLADLPDALPAVTAALEQRSARTSDVAHLMAATPPLARVLRYGSVRQTDTDLVSGVLDSVLVRVCAGLAAACVSLDDQAAAAMLGALEAADAAIALVGTAGQAASWRAAQRAVADLAGASSVVAGRCVRLLLDVGLLTPGEARQRLARALSGGGVAWLEGFLRGSGSLLLRDDRLWTLLDEWLSDLGETAFEAALPLLRRAFSQFTGPERRQMGVKVRAGTTAAVTVGRRDGTEADDWDESRARRVLGVVAAALGGCVADE
ncbi:MAG TPA: DUF5682 family protein, partial [Streptosporangiaceae bacterium]|nr:DUF5682 family protein [Streptosporangiaceae bacterium]